MAQHIEKSKLKSTSWVGGTCHCIINFHGGDRGDPSNVAAAASGTWRQTTDHRGRCVSEYLADEVHLGSGFSIPRLFCWQDGASCPPVSLPACPYASRRVVSRPEDIQAIASSPFDLPERRRGRGKSPCQSKSQQKGRSLNTGPYVGRIIHDLQNKQESDLNLTSG